MVIGMSVTGDRFRLVLGHVPTSVAIVSGLVAGDPKGLSVGTFVPVSLVPPMVGFFVGKNSKSWPGIAAGRAFCVSVLGEDQAHLSARFAISGTDKFNGVPWRPAPSGHPRIDAAVCWVDCALEEVSDAGDHVFVLARVLDLAVDGGQAPLLHHRGGYRRANDLEVTGEPGDADPDLAGR